MTTTVPRPEGLRVGRVWRDVFRIYRARFVMLATTAIIVFVPLAALDLSIGALLEEDVVLEDAAGLLRLSLVVLAVVAGVTFGGFGATFYAGLLDKTVGHHLFDHEHIPIRRVIAILPYQRLILANLALAVMVGLGLAFFALPGLFVLTLFCLVGPLINIEDHRVWSAFTRSARLVWPRFFFVFVAVTVPLLLEEGIEHQIEQTAVAHTWLGHLLVTGIVSATIGSIVGLTEVVVAFRLVEQDAPERVHHRRDRHHPDVDRSRPGGTRADG